MSQFVQKSFIGGMDQLSKDTEIAGNAYRLLINGRTRYGKVETIPTSLDVTYNLSGNIQGLYAFGSALIAFTDGNAFYKVEGTTQWLPVIGFSMDANVDTIFAQAVPISSRNFLRKAVEDSGVVNANAGIVATNAVTIQGNPAGVVCQDGINQPFLITYNAEANTAVARELGTYDSWSNSSTVANDREYVPIGTKMMFVNGILFILDTDNYTILRSVSGRPLDFMVNVDEDGNKLVTENLGGARSVSFAQSQETVNCLLPSTSEDTFLIGTANYIYGMLIDYTNTIFGEPTFRLAFTLNSGIVNQFCLTDKNGDSAIIDYEGVKTFNGIQQLKFEGRNDNFSLQVSKLLKGIRQSNCCATIFDNYNLFSVKTALGYAVLVYDGLRELWSGIDISFAAAEGISQFAITTTETASYLYCVTLQDNIYSLYSIDNTELEVPILSTRAFEQDLPEAEIKSNAIRIVNTAGTYDGTMFLTEIVDEKRGQKTTTKDLEGKICSLNYPIYPPVTAFDGTSRVENLTFTFNQGSTGNRISLNISWNNDAVLEEIELVANDIDNNQSQQQQSKVYA